MSKYDVILTPEDVKRACEECPDDPAVSPTSYLYATERALALAEADVEKLQKQVEDARDLIKPFKWHGIADWEAKAAAWIAAVDSEVSK